MGPDGKSLPVPEGLPNAHMRLFGGAQYHRAMAEFRAGIGQLTCPDISREEIVNACGVDDFHDGVNYTRTACVIAVSKARDIFEPFLHQVRSRTPMPLSSLNSAQERFVSGRPPAECSALDLHLLQVPSRFSVAQHACSAFVSASRSPAEAALRGVWRC